MNRIGVILLNASVALYLIANGILGFNDKWGDKGEFRTMSAAIFSGDLIGVVTIILSIFAIAAGIFLLLALFKIDVPITDTILLVFIIVWLIFIVIIDIIHPLQNKVKFLNYLVQLSAHLMVLGALITSTKRFGA